VSPLKSSNLNSIGGTLFQWLEEYLNRLENQVYIVQPTVLTNPSKINHKFKSISLFPTISSSTSRQETLGVEISCSSIFVPEKSYPSHQLFWTYSIGMRYKSIFTNYFVTILNIFFKKIIERLYK
jgi:hypothetical protein